MTPSNLLRYVLNYLCPNTWGLRQKVSKWTGLHLSRYPGCQATLEDELNAQFSTLALMSFFAVAPLVLYWLFLRFGSGRQLILSPPYTILTAPGIYSGDEQVSQTNILPMHLNGEPISFFPLVSTSDHQQ